MKLINFLTPLNVLRISKKNSISSNPTEKTKNILPFVYAVRILRSDISNFSIDGAGLNFRGVFPPKRLLARVPISSDRDIPQPGKNSDERLEARRIWSKRLNR